MADSVAEEAPAPQAQATDAAPAAQVAPRQRPQSARFAQTLTSEKTIPARQRPTSAHPSSRAGSNTAGQRGHGHAAHGGHSNNHRVGHRDDGLKEATTIAGALKEIMLKEKKSDKAEATSRPSSAKPFIPTRIISRSSRRPKSPRREILRTFQASKLEGPGGLGINEDLLVLVFKAKCMDLNLKASEERKDRFFELVFKNSKHKHLSLRETGIGPLAAAAVASMLMNQPSSTGVDLAGNSLKDQGMTVIAEMLGNDSTITSLDLRSNDIGVEGGQRLFEALKVNSTLTNVDLGIQSGGNRNRIGAKAATVLRDMLTVNGTLESLSMFGNGLGAAGCELLADGLRNSTKLKSLDLGLNSLKDEGVVKLAGALEGGGLEVLNLSNNAIGTRGMKQIAEVLEGGQLLLRSLDLSINTVSDRAGTALGSALANNSLLNTLHLDKTGLSQDGCMSLASGMISRSLAVLTLSDNAISDSGASALAKNLRKNTALTKLDLANNKIGDVGGTQIAAMLSQNTTLTSLSMADNVIGDAGGVLICNALLGNHNLRNMSLRGNALHDVTGSAMVSGLRGNTGLTDLDMSWNDINYSNYRSIETLIQEHAAIYRQGAVPRLKRELARLKKEEPKLAIREAELAEVTEERDTLTAETSLHIEELHRTREMQSEKLESSAQTLAESQSDGEARKAELKSVSEELEEMQKAKTKALASMQLKVDMGGKEVARMRAELSSLMLGGEEGGGVGEEEEAEHQQKMEAMRLEAEEAKKELDELKTRMEEAEKDKADADAKAAARGGDGSVSMEHVATKGPGLANSGSGKEVKATGSIKTGGAGGNGQKPPAAAAAAAAAAPKKKK